MDKGYVDMIRMRAPNGLDGYVCRCVCVCVISFSQMIRSNSAKNGINCNIFRSFFTVFINKPHFNSDSL